MANVTLTIDEDLLKEARKYAIDHDTSLSAVVDALFRDLVAPASALRAARIEQLKRQYENPSVRVGPITWTREELHER